VAIKTEGLTNQKTRLTIIKGIETTLIKIKTPKTKTKD